VGLLVALFRGDTGEEGAFVLLEGATLLDCAALFVDAALLVLTSVTV